MRTLNDILSNAADYQKYRLIKTSSRYGHDVENKLNKISKKPAVQMNDPTFSGKDSVSAITILQDFETAFDTCNVHNCTSMRLLSTTWPLPLKQ